MANDDEKKTRGKAPDGLLRSIGFKVQKIGSKKPGKITSKSGILKTKSAKPVNGAKRDEATTIPSSPNKNSFDPDTITNYENDRSNAGVDTKLCKHCKKVVEQRTYKEHTAGCLKFKQEKARKKKEAREAAQRAKERAERGADDDEDDDDDVRDGKSKKRKAEDDDKDKEPKKKKKKEEPKAKAAKAKGPVDVEKQCGVVLPNGAQCARSLTCKSHSMGAKRAVPGRSLPYDMLLQNYQKKNQARQQKAAIDANAPLQDEDLDAALTGPIDSDEERDSIMTAISRSLSRPQPIHTHTIIPTRRKYQLIRMKEMLSNALAGNRSGSMFAVPKDVPTANGADVFAVPASASSAGPTGGNMAQPGMKMPARKQSVDPT